MSAYFEYQNPPIGRLAQEDIDRIPHHFERMGRVLFADASDAERIARGEKPLAPLTDRRVFDDDIEYHGDAE